MNDIFKCSSYALFIAFLQICFALAVSSCDKDSTTEDEEKEEKECTDVGETESCDTEAGNPGFKVCLPEGAYTECMYRIPKTGQPCSDPGEEYACLCDGRLNGNMYCLDDFTNSKCFCESSPTSPVSSPTSPMSSAGTGGQETASESGDACPAPFSCNPMEMEPGGPVNMLCVEGGFPPFCEGNSDCEAAGLEGAQCVDVGMAKICLLVCS